MNWLTVDASVQAAEVPGAGCFVMVANKHVCFAPGVTLKREGAKLSLVAAPSTQIVFTTLGSTSGTTTTQWIGDAGEKLDAKLAEFERKKWRADKKAKNQAVDHSGKWPKWRADKKAKNQAVASAKLCLSKYHSGKWPKWRADKKAKNQSADAHTCPHCQRGFKWAALLKQHMASKHQK